MRNTDNETGEYELVVGNKQLLSGFFIVVVLCAVAFAMGYVVGQNSPRAAKLGSEPAAAASAGMDARPQPSTPAAPVTPPAAQPDPGAANAAQSASPSEGTVPPPQPTTQPARDAYPPAPAPAPAPPAEKEAAEAAPGSYWQVSATKNQESAHDLMQTLKDKGFPVQLKPGPENLTRVLVGPYTDTAAMGRAKTALENAGFRPVRK